MQLVEHGIFGIQYGAIDILSGRPEITEVGLAEQAGAPIHTERNGMERNDLPI